MLPINASHSSAIINKTSFFFPLLVREHQHVKQGNYPTRTEVPTTNARDKQCIGQRQRWLGGKDPWRGTCNGIPFVFGEFSHNHFNVSHIFFFLAI